MPEDKIVSPCSISSTSFRQRYNGMCACIIGFDIVWPLRCVCILRPNRAQLSQFVEPSQAKCCKRTGARNIDTVLVRCRVIKPRTASPSQAMPKRFSERSKLPSRAKPSLYNKYSKKGGLLEDKGEILFYQQYIPL